MCIYCEGAREDATDETAVTETAEDEHDQNTSVTAGPVQRIQQWVVNQ